MSIPTSAPDTVQYMLGIHKEASALYDRGEYALAHKLWQHSLMEAMQTIGRLQADLHKLKSERGGT
ncbi:MAG TPA: hypothetical protein VNG33_24390 [Polyangiaceae bacterium]|nr:hypothetical protein [Polyangiaceae bacterium]